MATFTSNVFVSLDKQEVEQALRDYVERQIALNFLPQVADDETLYVRVSPDMEPPTIRYTPKLETN